MLQSNKYEIVAKNSQRPNLSLYGITNRNYVKDIILQKIFSCTIFNETVFLRIQLFLFIKNGSKY